MEEYVSAMFLFEDDLLVASKRALWSSVRTFPCMHTMTEVVAFNVMVLEGSLV